MEKPQNNIKQATRMNSRDVKHKKLQKRRQLKINGAKAVLGDKCHDCGYDEHWEILEFHHAIPRKISGRPSMPFIKDWTWSRFRDEILEHCVLLCPNCHKKRHLLEEHDVFKFTDEIDI